MMGTAVQFGAGNIGRGFLAQLFHESGLEVVFVDVTAPIVEALNTRHFYSINIVGPEEETVPITEVRALHGRDRVRIAGEIARAEVVCTAVGAGALPHIAPAIAAGLLARYKSTGLPLNILICENLHDASVKLREMIAEHLPAKDRETVLEQTGLVQAVVSRMVPLQTNEDRAEDLLAVRAEGYKHLPVDANAVIGALPTLVGVEPTTRFAAYVERKLYVHNCAHAVLGYMGHIAGHTYGYEALNDPRIASFLRAVLDETGRALIKKHGFTASELNAHIEDLLERFQNKALGDTCSRLARDPLRKLAPEDRLVGAARLCESQGIEPRAISWAIAAALRYKDASDPSACAVRGLIRDVGLAGALQTICAIRPEEPLFRLIEAALNTTRPLNTLPH